MDGVALAKPIELLTSVLERDSANFNRLSQDYQSFLRHQNEENHPHSTSNCSECVAATFCVGL